MINSTAVKTDKGFSRLKLFFALSRTPHGLLDMVTPMLGALLWYNGIPPVKIVGLGLITVFAGYTAVYALNDVVDYRSDKEKARLEGANLSGDYLDAVLVRHPLAQGVLSFREGLVWALAWGILALIGAFLLNPLCALVFIAGCILETAYCMMLKVSYLRTFVSGVVKTCGCIAAVFAVDPRPSPILLSLLFAWLFVWEIGGQNIPADWVDTTIDAAIDAKTIPVRFGPRHASGIIMALLLLTVALSGFLFWRFPLTKGVCFILGVLTTGLILLIFPAFRLFRTSEKQAAISLFNRASYYPLSVFIFLLIQLLIQ